MARLLDRTYRDNHLQRLMACLAATLALLLAAVRLWPPARLPAPDEVRFSTRAHEIVSVEEIVPTAQGGSAPPPPAAPAPPVVVPDAVVLEAEPLDLDVPENIVQQEPPPEPGTGTAGEAGSGTPPDAGAGTGPGGATGTTGGPTTAPEVGPKTVRFVEPEYTREARRKKIRAEVVVEVLVDEMGRVKETKVVERFLLGRTPQDRRPVAAVGYGLEEAAVAAAERWVFRPARQQGKAVASYTTLTFTFGV